MAAHDNTAKVRWRGQLAGAAVVLAGCSGWLRSRPAFDGASHRASVLAALTAHTAAGPRPAGEMKRKVVEGPRMEGQQAVESWAESHPADEETVTEFMDELWGDAGTKHRQKKRLAAEREAAEAADQGATQERDDNDAIATAVDVEESDRLTPVPTVSATTSRGLLCADLGGKPDARPLHARHVVDRRMPGCYDPACDIHGGPGVLS